VHEEVLELDLQSAFSSSNIASNKQQYLRKNHVLIKSGDKDISKLNDSKESLLYSPSAKK